MDKVQLVKITHLVLGLSSFSEAKAILEEDERIRKFAEFVFRALHSRPVLASVPGRLEGGKLVVDIGDFPSLLTKGEARVFWDVPSQE